MEGLRCSSGKGAAVKAPATNFDNLHSGPRPYLVKGVCKRAYSHTLIAGKRKGKKGESLKIRKVTVKLGVKDEQQQICPQHCRQRQCGEATLHGGQRAFREGDESYIHWSVEPE